MWKKWFNSSKKILFEHFLKNVDDSIIAGLKLYINVWRKYFGKSLHFGIGGDFVENVFGQPFIFQTCPS